MRSIKGTVLAARGSKVRNRMKHRLSPLHFAAGFQHWDFCLGLLAAQGASNTPPASGPREWKLAGTHKSSAAKMSSWANGLSRC